MGKEQTVDFELINSPACQEVLETTVKIPVRKTVFTVIFILSLVVGLGYVGLQFVDTELFAQPFGANEEQPAAEIVKAVETVLPAPKAKVKARKPKPERRKTQVGVDPASGIAIMGIVQQGADGNWRLN